MKKSILILCPLLFLSACWKPMDVKTNPIPGNTLALEFSAPVKYVMDLKINGQEIPIRYAAKNRVLWVEGLVPGTHDFNINSISYVYGPEVGKFKITNDEGAYFFIQGRKYRSSTPKNRARVSIRAYRKKLKKEGIDANVGVTSEGEGGKIRAFFTRGR